LYDSFIAYQTHLIEQFDAMALEYGFTTLDATQSPQSIQRRLRELVGEYLRATGYQVPEDLAAIMPLQKIETPKIG